MKRLLIANRGEIVVRIARTARELGIGTVAVHAPEDRTLAAGYGCDDSIELAGVGSAAYLDSEALVEVARATGSDALHPGYGFLSESALFGRTVEKSGLVFVGPAPETIELLGDKARARAHAESLGIPVAVGIPAPATPDSVRAFLAESDGVIVLKAAHGGGGRGMRVVRTEDEIEEMFARCQSEAARSFGSDALFAERWVESARHVEVQIVGDGRGGVQHLWERDCSLQRRNQKLIEVAPAPGLDPDLRARLIADACRMAASVSYRGIGTIEFLVEPSGAYVFMEANPRIQVEHTVTEEITGLDLVEIQLGIARGETLESLGLGIPPTPRGFAVQARLLAESIDEKGTPRPSPAPIEGLSWPTGPGIRIDTAVRRGFGAHPAFDPLLAKIIVSNPDAAFDRVVDRARRALSDCRVDGPLTNLGLLRALLERPEFRAYSLDTGFVQGNAEVLHRDAARLGSEDRAEAPGLVPSPAASQVDESVPDGLEVISAPLLGTVIEIAAEEGDEVAPGQPVCVLEAMKMEHLVTATRAGRVVRRLVSVGEVIAENAALVWIEPAESSQQATQSSISVDLETIRPDLEEVHARLSLLEDEARPEAVERRRSRGQRTARENLAALCDRDSFVEYGGLAVAAQRRARPIEELRRRTPADAILTGLGTVNADRYGPEAARCAILVADATVLAGTQGFFHHHKIDRILDVAERHGTPVVFFPEGGGGRPNDTDVGDISAAGLTVTSFHAFARLSGKVPRVSIVSGFCFAGSAAFAGCADVIIATHGTSLGMGGPAMIEGGGLGVHAPEDVGPTSVQEPNGVIDILVEDETEAIEVAKRYLGFFQGREKSWTYADQRALRHVIPENRRRVYAIRELIETLCDDDSVLELRPNFGMGMITALVRIEGHAFGLIANDPMYLGGAIDDVGSEKAARFLQLCDAFGLPVLSLCDTPGFMVGPEIEARAQVRKVSRLFVVGASLSVPLFTIIVRKGYGLGAQAMAGGSFVTPVFTLAWPTGEIGGMGLEGAVDLGFKKHLDAQESPEEREALRAKLIDAMYEKGKALNAASQLEFDGVIDPADTRQTILRGLNSVGPIGTGSRRMIDTW